MKQKTKILVGAVLCFLLSGCFFRPPDDLYQLPERLAGYENLEQTIKDVRSYLELESGVSSEYAVIFAGENTSTIQLHDLDGDGERETAVTFLRLPGTEKPIKICFFTRDGEGYYRLSGMIEGDGTAIYTIDFADLNGQGKKDVVVSWQMGTGVYQLGAYTLDDLHTYTRTEQEAQNPLANRFPNEDELLATQLLLTSYSRYALQDIDQDTRTEIELLRLNPADSNTAEVYGWRDGAFSNLSTTALSSGIASIDNVRTNFVSGDLLVPALYVSSTLTDGEKAIDILVYRDGKFTNLTLDSATGVSRERLRGNTQMELTDINGDYVLEVPVSSPLPSSGEGTTDFWITDWNHYSLDGEKTLVTTTYHNRTDGWYLEIPQEWKGQLTISRTDRAVGQREVIFSHFEGKGKEPERFLAIYKLTGPNRSAWASTTNRFILQEDDDTIYAATLLTSSWDCGLDQAALRERFSLISGN